MIRAMLMVKHLNSSWMILRAKVEGVMTTLVKEKRAIRV
jgi:hypothetical protein